MYIGVLHYARNISGGMLKNLDRVSSVEAQWGSSKVIGRLPKFRNCG